MAQSINGLDVLALTITMPGFGVWHADAEVDAEGLTGAVVIDDGEGNTFSGRVYRSGEQFGRTGARIVGGTGGLVRTTLKPKHFRSVTLRVVAAEILGQAGERLDSTAQAAVLSRHLPYWSIGTDPLAPTPGAALLELVSAVGANWRMLANGAVWIGVDNYPAAPEFDAAETARDDILGIATLAVDAFSLRPGVTYEGRRVQRVEHRIDSAGLRTAYWYG